MPQLQSPLNVVPEQDHPLVRKGVLSRQNWILGIVGIAIALTGLTQGTFEVKLISLV